MHSPFCTITSLLFAMVTNNMAFARKYPNYNIFKPWQQCDISEVHFSEVPWTRPELVPAILAFRKNVLEGLKADFQVQKIWNSAPNSNTIRKIYFRSMNQVFSENNAAVPAALANIVSKGASLFNRLDKKTYFESDAVSIGQYLISKGIPLTAAAAKGYVDAISKAIAVGDISSPEAEFETLIIGWENFFVPYGFQVKDYQNDLIILFTNHLINLYDK